MASVFLGDLDDYIGLGQACVNPVVTKREEGGGRGKIVLQMERDEGEGEKKPRLIRSVGKAKIAKVALSDCLACSGCVTSAETVLIQEQSVGKFMACLQDGREKETVIFLSPQTIANIAKKIGSRDLLSVYIKCKAFFKKILNISHTYSTIPGNDLALVHLAEEFINRLNNRKEFQWKAPPTSRAISSTNTEYLEPLDDSNDIGSEGRLPMITSECPGWVCYAEKTYPEAIPYICEIKSAQQIMGAITKAGFFPHQVHDWKSKALIVAIMPCYDKKLEASRKDFFSEERGNSDVDIVMTSKELIDFMASKGQEEGYDIHGLDSFLSSLVDEIGKIDLEEDIKAGIVNKEGTKLCAGFQSYGESGGYCEYLYRYLAKHTYNVDVPDGPLDFRECRNSDFKEIELRISDEESLRFAICNGFRNIQTVVRQLKLGKIKYDFIELMACPKGCVNGGGQDLDGDAASVSALVGGHSYRDPRSSPLLPALHRRDLLRTRYHRIPKLSEAHGSSASW